MSRGDWIPKKFLHGGTAVISFLMQPLGFNFQELILNSYLFHGDFCFQGKNESSSIFTCSLPASTYLFNKLSF